MKNASLPRDPAAYRFEVPMPALAAAAAASGAPRTFAGVAYSGEAMAHHEWEWPIVIDLASLLPPPTCAVLESHDRGRRAGLCTLEVRDAALAAAGRLLSNPIGAAIAADADEGFPWQLSVHAVPGVAEMVASGQAVTVNGRALTGPLFVWRQTRIRELSFTPSGVDHRTSAQVFSTPAPPDLSKASPEVLSMTTTVTPPDPASEAVAALKTQFETLHNQLAAERAQRRRGEVFALFAEAGRAAPDAAALEHFLAVPEPAWPTIAAALRPQRPAAPDALFEEQATSGAPAERRAADDALVARMAALH